MAEVLISLQSLKYILSQLLLQMIKIDCLYPTSRSRGLQTIQTYIQQVFFTIQNHLYVPFQHIQFTFPTRDEAPLVSSEYPEKGLILVPRLLTTESELHQVQVKPQNKGSQFSVYVFYMCSGLLPTPQSFKAFQQNKHVYGFVPRHSKNRQASEGNIMVSGFSVFRSSKSVPLNNCQDVPTKASADPKRCFQSSE